MLVITRRIGEEVVVPQCNLVVKVVGVRGAKVRLGISAPATLEVHRREVWQRLRGESTTGKRSRVVSVAPVD